MGAVYSCWFQHCCCCLHYYYETMVAMWVCWHQFHHPEQYDDGVEEEEEGEDNNNTNKRRGKGRERVEEEESGSNSDGDSDQEEEEAQSPPTNNSRGGTTQHQYQQQSYLEEEEREEYGDNPPQAQFMSGMSDTLPHSQQQQGLRRKECMYSTPGMPPVPGPGYEYNTGGSSGRRVASQPTAGVMGTPGREERVGTHTQDSVHSTPSRASTRRGEFIPPQGYSTPITGSPYRGMGMTPGANQHFTPPYPYPTPAPTPLGLDTYRQFIHAESGHPYYLNLR